MKKVEEIIGLTAGRVMWLYPIAFNLSRTSWCGTAMVFNTLTNLVI